MHLGPILAALNRNRAGAALIALQITLTLAILCNALYIVQQKISLMSRPSGVDERNVFIIDNGWIGTDDIEARVKTDLNALRAVAQIESAYSSNMFPFENGGWDFGFSIHSDGSAPVDTAVYFGDEQTLHTLGVRLIAGRNFDAADVVDFKGLADKQPTNGVVISSALAQQLGHGAQMLGRRVTMIPGLRSATVIGIVDRLQTPWTAKTASARDAPEDELAAVLPYRFTSPQVYYVLRARPGQLGASMKAARDALAKVSRERVVDKIESLAQARHIAEGDNRAPVILLAIISGSLLVVTAVGIFGLASFWVTQRRRQIGIRRALGATRFAIVQHFQVENLLITGTGVAFGVALALVSNLWLVSVHSMERLPFSYLAAGVVVLLVLGQLAVFWPALSGASVPPAVATRTD